MFFASSVDAACLFTRKLLNETSVPHWRQIIKSVNFKKNLIKLFILIISTYELTDVVAFDY